jgi:nicotinate-nucleotide--dimethylbenzimidazole phosphoribosyltransferase
MNFDITPPDRGLEAALVHKINTKTKPVGSLGLLEHIALQMGLIQQSLSPAIEHPAILVFAGDHGIALTGLVNPYPQAVTAQMVLNFIRGGAAINVFCRLHNIHLRVIDAGVNYDFPKEMFSGEPLSGAPLSSPLFVSAKIRMGTRNYLEGPAMTEEECAAAIQKGADLVRDLRAEGCNTVGFGEMGIGNTTAAALIMASLTGIPLESCIGAGTGATEAQLETKRQAAARAFSLHRDSVRSGLDALRHFGGYEISMMTGAMLEAAAGKMTVIVDGFIATAALLAAKSLYPGVQDYCVFAHQSEEKGHRQLLAFLGAAPLLHLGLRLGEGTGAAMAMPLLRSGAAFLSEMASFESAGVSQA